MKRAVTAVVITFVVGLIAWGALHVFIAPVNPAQESPPGHASSACWACHLVLSSAQIVE